MSTHFFVSLSNVSLTLSVSFSNIFSPFLFTLKQEGNDRYALAVRSQTGAVVWHREGVLSQSSIDREQTALRMFVDDGGIFRVVQGIAMNIDSVAREQELWASSIGCDVASNSLSAPKLLLDPETGNPYVLCEKQKLYM